jgi:hypothetical protein
MITVVSMDDEHPALSTPFSSTTHRTYVAYNQRLPSLTLQSMASCSHKESRLTIGVTLSSSPSKHAHETIRLTLGDAATYASPVGSDSAF